MAKQITWMLSAILNCGMTLISCSDKDEPAASHEDPMVENLADMTIIFYGL